MSTSTSALPTFRNEVARTNPYLKIRPLAQNEPSIKNASVSPYYQKPISTRTPKLAADNDMGNQPATSSPTANQSVATSCVSSSASALIISAADKAGMEGIDRSKIDAIILRESGDSLYMQQQQKRDEKVNLRIQQLQERLREASPAEYQVTPELDAKLDSYVRESPSRSTCVVIDMDMFFMACELLTRPHLQNVPACVGRGMITTSNYVARRFGVRSAMPGFIGDKLVEELSGGTQKLVHVKSNFDLYREKSHIVKDVLKEYDPYNMKSYSLDEAYLDIGPYLALFMQHPNWTHEQIRIELVEYKTNHIVDNHNQHLSNVAMQFLQTHSSLACKEAADQVVTRMRRHVQDATGGLTCSAGLAPNVSLAKIASDKNKPNGQLLVDPSHILHFVHALPIRKIPGIGRVTEKILQQVCNVQTVKDLYDQRGIVQWLFQPATSEFLLQASVGCNGSTNITTSDFGMDDEDHHHESDAHANDHQKGISRERTFTAESDWTQISIKMEDIARMLAKDMVKMSVWAHTITVKVKLVSFDVLSRSHSLKRGVYIQSPEELVDCTSQLLTQIRAQYKKEHGKAGGRFTVRLLGVRCSNLISESALESSERGLLEKFLIAVPPSEKGATTITESQSTATIHTQRKYNDTESLSINPYVRTDHGICPKRSMSPNRTRSPLHVTESKNVAEKNGHPSIQDLLGHCQSNSLNEDTEDGTSASKKVRSSDAIVDETKMMQENYVFCPLCSRPFVEMDNAGLNAHVDTCLNRSTVRKAIRDVGVQSSQPFCKKTKRLTDFWGL